jgi:hypothetical protein
MKTTLLKVLGACFCTISIAASTLAATGLTHKWSGDGNANDSIGTVNGVISNFDGSTNIDVVYVTGKSNQAFAFDGNGYVDFTTNVAAFGSSDFAVGCWVNTTSNGVLLQKSGYGIGFALLISDGRVSCQLCGDNGATSVFSQSRINDGAFHHVMVQRSATDLYVFVDGAISGKSSTANVLNLPELQTSWETNVVAVYDETGTNQLVDADGNGIFTNQVDLVSDTSTFQAGPGFVGVLDEIEIYGRALSLYEIYQESHPGVGLAILDQPLNQRSLAGRPVIMHVLAVGVDPITYQWQFNGFDIPGAISNNLVLDSPQTFDSGTYTVLVSNPTADLMSRGATLTITNLMTPTNGLLARWSGEGTANDPFGGHNGYTSNIKYVPGVLGTCFQFNGSSSIQCGNVIGNIGTGDFTIDYWMQTTVTPNDRMPILGQRPSCSATDCMDFRLFNTGQSSTYLFAELGDHRDLLNPPFNYTAAKTSTLNNIHLNDGVFHHIAAVRHTNQLSLYVDGTFVQSVYSVEPCLLANNGSFDMGIGPCGGSFVGSLDEVEVFDRALTDQEVFSTYSPNPSLSIIRQPVTASTAEGNPFSFTVSAAGQDPITYQWRLNGAPISGGTESTYALTAAQLADAGVYTVVVSNPVGTQTSSSAQLNVVAAASMLPGLVNRWSAEGDYTDSLGHAQAPGGQTSFAPGVSGQAWDFVGEENIVGVDYYTGQVGYNDFTWALWIRYRADGTLLSAMPSYRFGVEGGLVTARLGDGSRDMGEWGIMFDSNAGSVLTTAPTPVNDGNFHHVAFVRQDLTNFSIYIDGSNAVQTVIPVFNFQSTWGLGIADDYGRSARFRGLMDEVELYNRALTPDEVASLYAKFANGPRAEFALQDMAAATGSSFTLNAGTFTGVGPATYQWTLNGVPVPGATDSTYTVASADTTSAGMYAVTITTADGSIASPIARVSIQLSSGTYNGLFYLDGDVTDDTSGFITLQINSSIQAFSRKLVQKSSLSQTFTGKIISKGYTNGFSGQFTGTSSTITVNRKNLSPLTITLNATGNKITGTVRDTTRVVPLQAQRAVYTASNPTPQAGAYTLQLVGLSSPKAPNGHGFGNVTITPDGSIKLIANLADDYVISQKAAVANSGVWPLYVPAYGGKGSVLGWLSFTNDGSSVCAGTLRWVKSAAPRTKNYKNGFATRIPVLGSTFKAPKAGLGIGLNNSSVVLDAAKIYTPLNAQVVSTNNNTIVFAQNTTAKALVKNTAAKGSVRIDSLHGRFTGTFLNPVTKKLASVKGIVLQNQSYAAGYFISSNLSGRMVLEHN